MKQITIYVPGIWNTPGSRNWVGRAVTHTHVNTERRAEKVEYFTSALMRPFGETSRAKKLSRILGFYQGWEIDLVGHSNGTDVILDGLDIAGWPSIRNIHFISAACEADFDINGLNDALDRGRIGSVFIYNGGKDLPLKLAGTPIGKFLGYGTLGRTGPINNRFPDKVGVVTWPAFGHSTAFTEGQFKKTMSHILK